MALPLAASMVLAGCAHFFPHSSRDADAAAAAMRFVYSPYKHVPIALDPVTHAISTAVRGVPTPLVVDGRSTLPRGP